MSVYDMDSNIPESAVEQSPLLNIPEATAASQKLHEHHTPGFQLLREEADISAGQIHQHRESTSTQSDSTESSPTSTMSTVDSSSVSDPSPSSSPESPITVVPLSSFAVTSSSFGLDSFQSLKMADNSTSRLPFRDDRPMTSPLPRKKNPKSLALKLTPSVEGFQSTQTAQTSEPPTPAFIKPPPIQARKKPSILSLNTGPPGAAAPVTLGVPGAANSLSIGVPPSPGMSTMLQRRGLKHSVSSPQMLSTPAFGPAGGMTLGERPPTRGPGLLRLKDTNLTMDTFTIKEDTDMEPAPPVQMATRVPGFTVGGDSFDRPRSGEDAKSPSYPEGPILMHEPSVHLYLEPKLEEAMQFDVIINVAKEVKNPFKRASEEREAALLRSPQSSTSDPSHYSSTPATSTSMMSFSTAFEVQPSGSDYSSTGSSPSTPRPAAEAKLPEYIHMPWDHNTDVKDELWDLCQLIESRTKEGKRVLIHCQQGASRSATLIIAYGMYINQDIGPNEAYSAAQSKSRWVNPNMSLLFSLNDFKKVIDAKKAEKNDFGMTQNKHRSSLSTDSADAPPTPSRARGNSTPSLMARDDVVSSMEEDTEITTDAEGKDVKSDLPRASMIHPGFDFGFSNDSFTKRIPQLNFGDDPFANRREPQLKRTWNPDPEPMSPRLAEMTEHSIHDTLSRAFDSQAPAPKPVAQQPVVQSSGIGGLFSPRAFQFPRPAFFKLPFPGRASLPPAAAADEDPRSPPMRGEAPLMQSIDDVL